MLTFRGAQVDLPTHHKTPTLHVPTLHTPVVRFPHPFILPTPDAHPDPTGQFIELAQAGAEGGGEGADCSTDDPVDRHDHLGIEVMPASGSRLDRHLAAFLRFPTHAEGAGRDRVAEEVESLTKGGPLGFLRVASQPELLLNPRRHGLQRLFRLTLGRAPDHMPVG